MKRTVLIFGLISGLIVTLMLFVNMGLLESRSLGHAALEWLGYLTMFIAFSTMYFGIRAYRDQQAGGEIRYEKAWWMGIQITFIASVMYTIGWMLYSTYVAPDLMDQFAADAIRQLKESGKPQSEIDQQMRFMELYNTNTWVKIGITFSEIFPPGWIVSNFSAAFLDKQTKIKNA